MKHSQKLGSLRQGFRLVDRRIETLGWEADGDLPGGLVEECGQVENVSGMTGGHLRAHTAPQSCLRVTECFWRIKRS